MYDELQVTKFRPKRTHTKADLVLIQIVPETEWYPAQNSTEDVQEMQTIVNSDYTLETLGGVLVSLEQGLDVGIFQNVPPTPTSALTPTFSRDSKVQTG